jgi:hypothetical protein
MLQKYIALGDLFHPDMRDSLLAERREVYLAEDVDRQLNDLRRAIRVVLSEWNEIEGSKIQSELRHLLANSYRNPTHG